MSYLGYLGFWENTLLMGSVRMRHLLSHHYVNFSQTNVQVCRAQPSHIQPSNHAHTEKRQCKDTSPAMATSSMRPAEFSHLPLKEFARVQERETPEARYWKALNNVKEVAVSGSPNAIHFNPAFNNSYIVTASTKVSLIDALSDKVQRSYSRFTDDAFSGRFRGDGKLIAAGEKTGVVKIFDMQTKSLLRQLRRHTGATRCVRWSADGINLVSGSDDKHALRWDIATEEVVWSSRSHHSDYVRAIDCHPTSSDVFVT
eukprot:gene18247-21257_t